MTLHVVAHFHALPDCGDEMEKLLFPLVGPTSAEDGCISYRLHRDHEDPEHFVFLEEWRDAKSLEAHLGSPHVTTMLSAVEPLCAAPITAYRLRRY